MLELILLNLGRVSLASIKKTNLGKNVNYPVIIDEAILDLIPRNEQRKTLKNQTFIGVDYWNAYEFMWLDQKGYQQIRVLHIAITTE